MLHRVLVVVMVASAGCAEGRLAAGSGDGSLDSPDARPQTSSDGGTVDAETPGLPDAAPQPSSAKLLLTEVVLAPSAGEYIEIANPGTAAVDLSTYYLSDSGNYFRTPAGPTVDSTDFIVKFPAGATLPGKGVVTVALDTAANFAATYGTQPTYSLATMVSVAAVGVSSLTNAGEIVVLFQWDGASDNVRDVDLLLAGVPSVANGIVDKSGVAVDGPDADSVGTPYKTDARSIAAQASAAAAGKSTKRVAKETGNQTGSAGNGITGEDETSENTGTTWDSTAAFSAPTPNQVPAGLL